MSRPIDCPRVDCTKCHQTYDGHTNCLSLTSDYRSRARDAEIILFQPEFVMTMSVTFCKTDHSEKIHYKVISRAWLLKCHQANMGHTNCLRITSDFHN